MDDSAVNGVHPERPAQGDFGASSPNGDASAEEAPEVAQVEEQEAAEPAQISEIPGVPGGNGTGVGDPAAATVVEAGPETDVEAEAAPPPEPPLPEPSDVMRANGHVAETPAEAPAEASEAAVEGAVDAVRPEPGAAESAGDADAEPVSEEEDEILPEWKPGDWFVVHTYAGYENKVRTNLQTRISSMNMEEKIFEVVIPMEDVTEIKSGKKQVVQKKVFPGYLLVRMDLDDDSWYVVRNTPGVTGFVGSGTKPIPLSEKEVDRILTRKGVEEKVRPRLEFQTGDGVRVVAGPFANFQGVISDIDADRSKLKVLVNIFGRETPVELGFDQVAKL